MKDNAHIAHCKGTIKAAASAKIGAELRVHFGTNAKWNKVENKRWPQKQETSTSDLRSHDEHRRDVSSPSGMDSDDDEICWKSMMG